MTEEQLNNLWAVLRSAANVDNLEYGAAVTIGGVFGDMKKVILEQQKEIEELQQYKQAFEASRKAGVDLQKPMNQALLKGMKHNEI